MRQGNKWTQNWTTDCGNISDYICLYKKHWITLIYYTLGAPYDFFGQNYRYF